MLQPPYNSSRRAVSADPAFSCNLAEGASTASNAAIPSPDHTPRQRRVAPIRRALKAGWVAYAWILVIVAWRSQTRRRALPADSRGIYEVWSASVALLRASANVATESPFQDDARTP